MSPSREKTKVAKVSQGVEDGPDTKRARLDSSETTMVKKVCILGRRRSQEPGPYGDRQLQWCTREASMVGLKGGSGQTGPVLVLLKGGQLLLSASQLSSEGMCRPRITDVI